MPTSKSLRARIASYLQRLIEPAGTYPTPKLRLRNGMLTITLGEQQTLFAVPHGAGHFVSIIYEAHSKSRSEYHPRDGYAAIMWNTFNTQHFVCDFPVTGTELQSDSFSQQNAYFSSVTMSINKQIQSIYKYRRNPLKWIVGIAIVIALSYVPLPFFASSASQHVATPQSTSNEVVLANELAKADLAMRAALPNSLVIGAGAAPAEKTIFLFSDPNCQFCKAQEKILSARKDLHIRVFPVAFKKGSADAAAQLLCAKTPPDAWRTWMLDGKMPAPQTAIEWQACVAERTAGIEANNALFKTLGMTETPSLLASDGKIVAGVVQAKDLP